MSYPRESAKAHSETKDPLSQKLSSLFLQEGNSKFFSPSVDHIKALLAAIKAMLSKIKQALVKYLGSASRDTVTMLGLEVRHRPQDPSS